VKQIAIRTEYSFRTASGKISEVVNLCEGGSAGICDRFGTWGHLPWRDVCRKAGKIPLFGVELAVVNNADEREKQPPVFVNFIAKTRKGLQYIYDITSLSTDKFYYIPRIDWGMVDPSPDDLIIIIRGKEGAIPYGEIDWKSKGTFLALSPGTPLPVILEAKKHKARLIAVSDNRYPTPEDKGTYDVIMGRFAEATSSTDSICNEWDFNFPEAMTKEALRNLDREIKAIPEIELEKAEMVHPKAKKSLAVLCREGAREKGVDLKDPVYAARLKRELTLIKQKNYTDYFQLVCDLVRYAKTVMFVGPARGSSCGSLVCYLIGITDIDPIPYGLLFERFIDLNREDLPDIDIDFADDRRDMVFNYLRDKYGAECVARLGTVSYFKSKSAITDCAKNLRVPVWETEDIKGSIIERSSGDSRAQFCLEDTFQLDTGKAFLEKYPEMRVCADVEGSARHTGVHAAAILVTANPVTRYCAVDYRTGAAMIDKSVAEKIDLLKIDALGLRTLSVLQDALDHIGMTVDELKAWSMDDKEAFEVLNENRFWGIFQFEGYALQNLTKQMGIRSFEDIVSITALARPGPLASGGAMEFILRRRGESKIEYLHETIKPATEVTLGVVVYQEQVMQIAREMGGLSWEDVSQLRKAMSKSMGKEFFDSFYERFLKGALKNGVTEEKAKHVWDHINTMGSWAFNRSHAVAYGMMSYWCMILKAHWPLEFAAASLRNAKDETQSIKILRELTNEGYEYLNYHRDLSQSNWSVSKGKLIGGLTGIKGIGLKVAADIVKRRKEGKELTKRQETLLTTGETPWDTIFEARDRWGHILDNPASFNILSTITPVEELMEQSKGTFVIVAKITEKNIRDHNELIKVEQRGGKMMEGQTKYLNMTLEDDTGSILGVIDRRKFMGMGRIIIETAKIGEWFIWKGTMSGSFRALRISRMKKLTGNPEFRAKNGQ